MRYLYTFLFICILHSTASAQVADFTYTTSGNTFCDPQRVTFRQTSSGNPVSFVWHFGNGTSGHGPVEEATYINPGTYTVKLIAIYNNVAVTKEKQITIHPTPSITLTANRNTMCEPGVVNFTAGGSSDVQQYQWDFGDGSTPLNSTSLAVSHRFNNFGTFTVKVTATNDRGCSETATSIINILPLTINAHVDVTNGCIPATSNFSLSGNFLPGDAPNNITWNFGDGTSISGTGTQVAHVYNTTTPIQASVTVVTQNGCRASVDYTPMAFGTPLARPVIQTSTGQNTFCGSEEVEMTASSNQASYYVWDYGDGTRDSINRNTTNHKFRTLGDLYVKVTPYFNGCAGETDSILLKIQGVIAKFDVRNTCQQLNAFTFPNNSLGNMTSILWLYGGATNSTQETVRNGSFTYPPVATSYVEIKISDEVTGCRDSLKRAIYTARPTLRSNLSSVCKDSSITYYIENDYPPEANLTYIFNANDRIINNGNVNTIDFKPLYHGLYNDYVVLHDQYRGTCNDTMRLTEPVRVKGPIADFSLPTFVCYDSLLTFENRSYPYYAYEPIQQWNWNMGNGTQLTEETPAAYSYDRPGSYNVVLTVTDVSGCAQKMTVPTKVIRLPKVDILPRKDSICLGTGLELIAYSSDEITWLNLPSNICAACDSVFVTPLESVHYIAQTTNSFGCRNFDSIMLYVVQPTELDISPMDTTLCLGSSFKYLIETPGVVTFSPSLYLNNANIPNPTVHPLESIEYTVKITDSLGCFTDSATSNITVIPKPFINAGDDLQLNYGDPFNISPVTDNQPLQFNWSSSVGMVTCPTCRNVSGRIEENMTYTVEVTDQHGCTNIDRVNLILQCTSKQLLLPSAFTPNGDGLNDYFYPISRGFSEVLSFSIFDRAGMKVFERKQMPPNQPTMGWDGRIRGALPNTQSFVWMAQVECDGKIIVRKGTFTLIR